jgi:hypothetical protein
MKRKTVFLILLLVATAIPTVLSIIGLGILLSFYIRMGGNVQVWWHGNVIELAAHGEHLIMENVVLFIFLGLCVPFFFASVLLLYRE